MKERPIIFGAPMVRALLDGSKTQTRRRAIKTSQPHSVVLCDYDEIEFLVEIENQRSGQRSWLKCPHGVPGDRLWVRESFARIDGQTRPWIETDYQATYQHGFRLGDSLGIKKRWKSPIFMPRHASRITLEITGLRVERLHDISEMDCIAEGAPGGHGVIPGYGYSAAPWEHYRYIWETVNGPDSWTVNPWVWVLEFRKLP